MSYPLRPLRRYVESACDGPFGSAIASDHYVASGARVIRLGNIGAADWIDADAVYLPLNYWSSLEGHHAIAGDLVVAALGDDRNSVGRAAVVPDLGPALVKADCHRLRLNPTGNAQYLAYYLSSWRGRYEAGRLADGSTRKRLTIGKTLSVPVPDLPASNQRMIADFLDTETARFDALIAKKLALATVLRERHLAMIFEAVTGAGCDAPRRDSGGISWIGDLPAYWGAPWLGANYETQLGKMLDAKAAAGTDQWPYVRNMNVQWDRVDLDDLATMQFSEADRRRCELREGDLLVCEGGEVGRAAVWPKYLTGVYFQKAIHRVRPLIDGNTRFLLYCLRAATHLNVFAVEGNQSTFVHLTGEKLREHRFPFPPPEEQATIVCRLDEDRDKTRALTDALNLETALLQERRQALITAAVTGEMEIPGVSA